MTQATTVKQFGNYDTVLETVRQQIASHLSGSIDDIPPLQLKELIFRYITANSVKCSITSSANELTEYIYHDMAGYSFITREKIFDMEYFEELNVNSWDDVDIKIAGVTHKTDYRFLSPQHAIDIHQRMLRHTKTVLDDAMPRAISDLGKNIRICVEKSPIVDEDVAIASSIRLVRSGFITRDELLKWGTANDEMIDFLLLCLRYGVSVCISGETGSGKTTLAGALIAIVSEKLRTVTIEEGSREWDFRRKENGKYTNSVVHLKTRPHDDPNQPKLNITQETLVKDALRLDPDFLPIGEMRGEEAFEVMGASNTGHTVITTIHSNGTKDTPLRLITLAKKACDMSDPTLLSMASMAFPVLVHVEICPDKKRRITEIAEVEGYDGKIVGQRMLYMYDITDNEHGADGSITTIGDFERYDGISHKLAQRMLKKGASKADLQKFIQEV